MRKNYLLIAKRTGLEPKLLEVADKIGLDIGNDSICQQLYYCDLDMSKLGSKTNYDLKLRAKYNDDIVFACELSRENTNW